MTFSSLTPAQVASFLRHASLDEIFELARDLGQEDARRLRSLPPAPRGPRRRRRPHWRRSVRRPHAAGHRRRRRSPATRRWRPTG